MDLGCGAGRKAVIRHPVKEFRPARMGKTLQIESEGELAPVVKARGVEARQSHGVSPAGLPGRGGLRAGRPRVRSSTGVQL